MEEAYPKELKYSQTHEWVRKEPDGSVVVGVTDFAQHSLGEIVYVELPDADVNVAASDEVCVVESVKAASDVYTPLSGKICETNGDLEDAPGLINRDPYGDGWLFKLSSIDEQEFEELLDADAYKSSTEIEVD